MVKLFVAAIAVLVLAACDTRPPRQEMAAPAGPRFSQVTPGREAHGERLARILGCLGCHGEDLTGEDWSEPGFGRLWTSNLTRALPRYSDAQLARTIVGGVRPDGSELWEMPSHLFTALAPEDMAALIDYLRSRPPAGEAHPPPAFEEGARREIEAGTLKSSRAQVREEGNRWPPDAGPPHALARYIVRATCAECHGMDLGGSQPNPSAAPRPDLRVVAAAYDRAEFTRLLRTGIASGERRLGLMGEVARGRYRHFTDAEIAALHDYLRALAVRP